MCVAVWLCQARCLCAFTRQWLQCHFGSTVWYMQGGPRGSHAAEALCASRLKTQPRENMQLPMKELSYLMMSRPLARKRNLSLCRELPPPAPLLVQTSSNSTALGCRRRPHRCPRPSRCRCWAHRMARDRSHRAHRCRPPPPRLPYWAAASLRRTTRCTAVRACSALRAADQAAASRRRREVRAVAPRQPRRSRGRRPFPMPCQSCS